MAEYVMAADDNRAEVSRALMEHAGPDRAGEIEWRPRPNVPGGGVFVMPDDLADGYKSDRVSRLDDNENGERIRAATDGRTAEQKDPTEFNDLIAAGEAPTAASPASGPNPLAHLQEDQQADSEPAKRTRAQKRAAAKADDTTK